MDRSNGASRGGLYYFSNSLLKSLTFASLGPTGHNSSLFGDTSQNQSYEPPASQCLCLRTVEGLLDVADAAVYAAERSGRSTYSFGASSASFRAAVSALSKPAVSGDFSRDITPASIGSAQPTTADRGFSGSSPTLFRSR